VGRFLTQRVTVSIIQLFAVGLLILVVYTGSAGTLNQNRNFAVVFVWVIWWVGLAYFSALVGDLWLIVNPWKVTFEWAGALFRVLTLGRRLAFNLPYPKWLGVWPGVLLFWAFAWIELVYYAPSHPPNIALMAINYSYITWMGMLLFGKQKWLRQGEAFSLAFSLLARFAPTEFRVVDPAACGECQGDCLGRDGECINCYDCFERARNTQREWNLRPFAVGLMRDEGISFSHVFFVLLLLSSVTFDGFIATPLWESVADYLKNSLPIGTDEGLLYRILPLFKGRPMLIIFTLGLTAVRHLFPFLQRHVGSDWTASFCQCSSRKFRLFFDSDCLSLSLGSLSHLPSDPRPMDHPSHLRPSCLRLEFNRNCRLSP